MAKIDKDQFEEYMEQNCPVEEPSPEVFQHLQKEAAWNQPPASAKHTITFLLLLLLVVAAGFLRNADLPKAKKPEKIPVLEKIDPEPINIIATVDSPFDSGICKLIRFDSNDFNLSFEDDSSGPSMLAFSRGLDNI
ncbi:MAG: hypothetical protein KKB51_08625 [Candidatus Riflebacteria bacterium]|nr:hypothetical protein [Candidatus Riflebacteria bacterium]